ncbi:MAG: hypothetical protein PHX87_02675 [Candidatus Peribacteraceae bacterium]|nr:hypothetical protein [Candidatus Peribacteraceae bacterium]MDD5742312.1 hypothetical protein [Candidatus Peribacteraceae bacterium]
MIYYRWIEPRLFWGTSVSLLASFFILDWIIVDYLAPQFASGDAVTFFVSGGAATGTILAIAFSLQTIVIQNAAERRSAGLYDEIRKDKTPLAICAFLSLITLSFFGMAIAAPTHPTSIASMLKVGTALMGVVLWVLYFFYRHTFNELDPVRALVRIEKSLVASLKELEVIAHDATIVLKWQSRKDGTSKELAEAAAYGRMKPRFREINKRLGFLYDYHDKLLASQEKRSAKFILESIKRVLQQYIMLRSGSSLRIPISLWGTTESDSQDFLAPNLEELMAKGKAYIKADDDVGANTVAFIFRDLALTAGDVKYVNERGGDNPITTQCRGYFDELLKFALAQMNREVIFQGAAAYGQLSMHALDRGQDIEFDSINRSLFTIGLKSVTNHEFDIVWGRVVAIYAQLAMKLAKEGSSFGLEMRLKSVIEHWEPLLMLVSAMLSKRFGRGGLTLETDYLCNPLIFLAGTFNELDAAMRQATDPRVKEDLQEKIMILADQIYFLFRELSEHLKSANSLFVKTIADISGRLGCYLLQLSTEVDWQGEKAELLKRATGYVYLPHRFVRYAEKFEHDLTLDALVNAATVMGIVALEKGEREIAKHALDTVSYIATEVAKGEKGSFYDFESTRIMARAGYIGLLAHKMGDKELVEEFKKKLSEFEETWTKKFGEVVGRLDSSERVEHAMWALRDKKGEYKHPYDISWILEEGKPETKLLELVDIIDIDRFCLDVWKSFVSPSPLEKELGLDKKNRDPVAAAKPAGVTKKK